MSRSKKARAPRCPICRREAVRANNRWYPFCSQRCQLVDLGRWLDGDYRVPVADSEGYESGPRPDVDD